VGSIADLTAFYTKLSGLLSADAKDSLDSHGRTVLHLAINSGNLAFIKFLVEVQGGDVNLRDARGRNALCTLICGDRILIAQPKVLEYLLQRGCSPNVSYTEKRYGALEYQCTPVIHAIRHESKDRTNIRIVLKTLLDKGANPNAQDSLGRDALMYCVTRNHANTFDFILSSVSKSDEEIKENKGAQLKLDSVDKRDGRSLIHYIVDPLPFGSFENEELLRQALAAGFDACIRDAKGLTPYEYALKQKSGVLKQVLEELVGLDKLKAAIQYRPIELD
jgi:ankyrin repeat protein